MKPIRWLALLLSTGALVAATELPPAPGDRAAETSMCLGQGEQAHLLLLTLREGCAIRDLRDDSELVRFTPPVPAGADRHLICLGLRPGCAIVASWSHPSLGSRERSETLVTGWSLDGKELYRHTLPAGSFVAPRLGRDGWLVWAEPGWLRAQQLDDGRRIEVAIDNHRPIAPPLVSGSVAWNDRDWYSFDQALHRAVLDLTAGRGHLLDVLQPGDTGASPHFQAWDLDALPCPPGIVAFGRRSGSRITVTATLDGELQRVLPLQLSDHTVVSDGRQAYLWFDRCLIAWSVPDLRCQWARLLPISQGSLLQISDDGDLVVGKGRGAGRRTLLIDPADGSTLGSARHADERLVAANRSYVLLSHEGWRAYGSWDPPANLPAHLYEQSAERADKDLSTVITYLNDLDSQEGRALVQLVQPSVTSDHSALLKGLTTTPAPPSPATWALPSDGSLARQYRSLYPAGDLLLAARDRDVVGLDRHSGQERWRRPNVAIRPMCDGMAEQRKIIGRMAEGCLLDRRVQDSEDGPWISMIEKLDRQGETTTSWRDPDHQVLSHRSSQPLDQPILVWEQDQPEAGLLTCQVLDPASLLPQRAVVVPDAAYRPVCTASSMLGLRKNQGRAMIDLRSGRGWRLPTMRGWLQLSEAGAIVGSELLLLADGSIHPCPSGRILQLQDGRLLLFVADRIESWRFDESGSFACQWARPMPDPLTEPPGPPRVYAVMTPTADLVLRGLSLIVLDPASGSIRDQIMVHEPRENIGYHYEILADGGQVFVSTNHRLLAFDLEARPAGSAWRQTVDRLLARGAGDPVVLLDGLRSMSLYAGTDPTARERLAAILSALQSSSIPTEHPVLWQDLLQSDGWVLEGGGPDWPTGPDHGSRSIADSRLRSGEITPAVWRERRLAEIRATYTDRLAQLQDRTNHDPDEAAAYQRLIACLAKGRAEPFDATVHNLGE